MKNPEEFWTIELNEQFKIILAKPRENKDAPDEFMEEIDRIFLRVALHLAEAHVFAQIRGAHQLVSKMNWLQIIAPNPHFWEVMVAEIGFVKLAPKNRHDAYISIYQSGSGLHNAMEELFTDA